MKKTPILLVWLLALLSVASLWGREKDTPLDSVDEVLQSVSRLRNLQPLGPVQTGIRTRDQIRAYLVEKVRAEYPREEILAQEAFLKYLGLVPQDLDLYTFMIDLLTEQLAGFYDDETKTFYLADWIPLDAQKPVIAHELMHALQDQHFGLARFLEPVDGNDDATLARGAVIEGEGLIIMLDYLLQDQHQSALDIPDIVKMNEAQKPMMVAEFPIFGHAPAYLQDSLVFPYSYGAQFIQALLRDGSWERVTALYQHMPVSSEQILHPEKYLDGSDVPIPLDTAELKSGLGDQWHSVYQNVLGEYGWFLVLRGYVGADAAREASEGWGGDAVELLEDGDGHRLFLLSSQWDSADDAAEFFDSLSQAVTVRFPQARPAVSGSQAPEAERRVWEFGENSVTIQLQGPAVKATELISN